MYKDLFKLFIGIAIVGISTYTAKAETAQEYTGEQYLNNHGHSKEIVRLVNLQKNRTQNIEAPAVKNNKIKRFFKNIIIDSDFTTPTSDFGTEPIK